MTVWRLKLKYRERTNFKKNQMRTRTGPFCCTANCPSGRKKSKRVISQRGGMS